MKLSQGLFRRNFRSLEYSKGENLSSREGPLFQIRPWAEQGVQAQYQGKLHLIFSNSANTNAIEVPTAK